MRVGYFPFKPGGNPYQTLFAAAIEGADKEVLRIAPAKWFPLQKACAEKFDILQLDWPHDWYRGKNIITSAAKRLMYLDGLRRLRKTPVVWTAHNLVAHDSDKVEFEKKMIQQLINVTDGIIVMSELAQAELKSIYQLPKNTIVRVIPHGHYMDVYPNTINKLESRKKLNIPEGAKVALSLGRLMPYKGLEDLIVDFGAVAHAGSVLLIAGSCSSAEYAAQLIALAKLHSRDEIKIKIVAEFIKDEELQVFFNAADFVVLPFRNILNSGSLMLAMSFGKCVVAPDIGSIREVVCDEGWVGYSANCSDGLKQALVQCFGSNDHASREPVIKNYVREKYGWGSIGKQVVSLYSEILSR